MVETIKISIGGVIREVFKVPISRLELEWASYAGILRHHDSESMGRRRSDGTDANEVDHALGSVGEFATSLGLEIPWRGPGSFRGEDLIGGIEVRTRSNFSLDLPLRSKDPDDVPFVLVTATEDPLVWLVIGWILGKDGKDEIFRANRSNQTWDYFVDKPFLKPIKELKKKLKEVH